MKSKYLLLIILIAFIALEAGSDPVIKIKATGKASPGIQLKSKARAAALRAAKVVGYKKLAEAGGFSKIFRTGKRKHIEVDTFLKGARVVAKKYLSDYEAEIVMEIKAKDIYQAGISQLKLEIKTIETRISILNGRLEDLKEMLEALGEKIKREGN